MKPRRLHRIEGHNGMICCEVQSNPPVLYTWLMKNNEKYKKGNGTNYCLIFTTFNRNDSGYYTCSAENIMGKSNSSTELKILCKYN